MLTIRLFPQKWFIGRGLNPRIGSFDIKAFNEMRPGLILWVIIDLAMIAWQYERIGRVTDSIILTTAFHAFYVLDAEFNEVSLALFPLSRGIFVDRVSRPLFTGCDLDHDGSLTISLTLS
jgi:hypothetical protein